MVEDDQGARPPGLYRIETEGVLIEVSPQFLEAQSAPELGRYVWSYAVRVTNQRERSVRLLRRRWRITDRLGRVDEVAGDGVVGQQPWISSGRSFEYASAAPLREPSGVMEGSYEMLCESGATFRAKIPVFSLDSRFDTPVLQ